MSSMRKTRKAQRFVHAGPSVVVVIIGATAHNPNTSPPAVPCKANLAGCVSGQFLRGCCVAIWLLVGGAALPGGGTESQAYSSVISSNSA